MDVHMCLLLCNYMCAAEQFQEDIGTLHVDAADQRAVADSCTALKNALWTATDVLQARASR